ncbi:MULTISPECIES: hypothetical protein [Methylobacterium]|uniref:hypothetical protein n=1 Tax=Methylobacterium TaxID=407 RepID=UPI000345AEB2|nr:MULTISPECIES: hypothetical protein [Methylobacterium]MBN4096879.1 hypothetical protein [Methylobacterium sp. OT2]UIN36115.1 hypothetical protein LXM90_06335 [Methylobacterium oryzae]SEF75602.1 hypothetical protein SAMN04488144_104209 [Methylobacterium sp. 190mf]
MRRALAALALALPPAVPLTAAADDLPPPVAASAARAEASCGSEPATLKPGFITRQDVNGDAVPDFILDFAAVQCGDDGSAACGTAGCEMQVFASTTDGFVDAFDAVAHDLRFRTVGGRPAVIVDMTGATCGRSGQDPCGAIAVWNGRTFGRTR